MARGKALKVNAVSSLLSTIRGAVGYFHWSTAAALLKQNQLSLNLANHKLIIDMQTGEIHLWI